MSEAKFDPEQALAELEARERAQILTTRRVEIACIFVLAASVIAAVYTVAVFA